MAGIFDEGSGEGIFGLGTVDKTAQASATGGKEAPGATGTSAAGTLTTPGGIVGGDVRVAQANLQQAGFNIGSTGVDGVFGPCTAAALRAYIGRHGEALSVHMFGSTLVARAGRTTGACGVRQPSAPAPGTPGAPGVPGEVQAGILSIPGMPSLPALGPGGPIYTQWWFWLGVASVSGLGYFGWKYYQDKKAEEEMDLAASGL